MVDGWIVPEDLSKTFAEGRQNKVDVLLGSNSNEGGSFGGFGPPVTPRQLAGRRRAALERPRRDRPARLSGEDRRRGQDSPRGGRSPTASLVHAPLCRHQAAGPASRPTCTSSRAPASAPGKTNGGASHAAELAYVFGSPGHAARGARQQRSGGWSARARPDHQAGRPDDDLLDQLRADRQSERRGLPNWPQVTQMQRNAGDAARRRLQAGRHDDAGPGRAVGRAVRARYRGCRSGLAK